MLKLTLKKKIGRKLNFFAYFRKNKNGIITAIKSVLNDHTKTPGWAYETDISFIIFIVI